MDATRLHGRAYLQLARTHTLPLEVVPAIVGALLAVGTRDADVNWVVASAVFGGLYHVAGYSMNSYKDWENGYDKNDKSKSHHPLNTGAITPKQASRFVNWAFVASLVLGVVLAYFSSATVYALLVMFIGGVSGVLYNKIGKRTYLKPVFISVAHSSVPVFTYVVSGGSSWRLAALLGLLMFMIVFYQISVSGELKDYHESEATGEVNIVKDMIEGHRDILGKPDVNITVTLSLIRFYTLLLAVSIMLFRGYRFRLSAWLIALVVLTAVSFLISYDMIRSRLAPLHTRSERVKEHLRQDRLRMMAAIEILSLFTLLTVAYETTSAWVLVGLGVGSVVWVVAFNKCLWSTTLGPAV